MPACLPTVGGPQLYSPGAVGLPVLHLGLHRECVSGVLSQQRALRVYYRLSSREGLSGSVDSWLEGWAGGRHAEDEVSPLELLHEESASAQSRAAVHRCVQSRRRCARVPAQMWASLGADVGESRRRCGRVPAQMWASPGADVGESRGGCIVRCKLYSAVRGALHARPRRMARIIVMARDL